MNFYYILATFGEAQNSRCLKSTVKLPLSVMIWDVMLSANVGPLRFIKLKLNTVAYQILKHFMSSSSEKLYGDSDFIFQQDLAPGQSTKTTTKWFPDYNTTVLDWPANSPDLNPILGIVKRNVRANWLKNTDKLKAKQPEIQ